MNLVPDLQAYLDERERSYAAKKGSTPRLQWACGEEALAAPIHLAFNASAYVLIGQFMQTMSRRPARILDLGCGTGGDTCFFRKRFAPDSSVVGVDINASLTRFASTTYADPNLRFETADACRLPFADESFDMVMAVFSMVHTMSREEAHRCLGEIRRVLTPGGTLLFSTPNRRMSQDHYHLNPTDDPSLMFSPLLRHEYRREDLDALLEPFVGKGRLFSTSRTGSLVNRAFRPVWRETIQELARRRFDSGRTGELCSQLVRRWLPAPYLARCYFQLIWKSCKRLNVTLRDIVQAAQYHDDAESVEADHFVVIAQR